MIKNNLFIFFVLSILFLGCNSKNSESSRGSLTEMEEYTYKFSMESLGNYKVDFQLNPDSTYQINQQNYFFDRYSGTGNPTSRQGKLTADEFDQFDKLVRESDLYGMDDSYGFDDNTDSSIMYIIELREGENVKYVSVNPEVAHNFSVEFTDLIESTTKFMDSKLVD